MSRLLCLVVFTFLGCPKASPRQNTGPLGDPALALSGVYRALEAGNADLLEPFFTDDALVFGLGPGDTWQGNGLIVEHVRGALVPVGLAGWTMQIEGSRPVVGFAEEGASAWLSDFPKVVVTHAQKSEVWLPRVTAQLVREGERWRIDALHVSLAVPDELISLPDAPKRWVVPADVTKARSPRVDQVVGLVRRVLEDYGVKIERTSERDEFVQLGTSPTELFVGGKTFKALLKPQLPAIQKAGYSWKVDGNIAARVDEGAKAGWVAALVVQRQLAGRKQQTYPTFRVLWTLIQENGIWNISSEHQSLAMNDDFRTPANDEQLKAWKQAHGPLDSR